MQEYCHTTVQFYICVDSHFEFWQKMSEGSVCDIILINLFKYLLLSTELMYLSLNKLTSMYGKGIVLILYTHCIKLKESHNHSFSFVFSYFSFVSNAKMSSFIP